MIKKAQGVVVGGGGSNDSNNEPQASKAAQNEKPAEAAQTQIEKPAAQTEEIAAAPFVATAPTTAVISTPANDDDNCNCKTATVTKHPDIPVHLLQAKHVVEDPQKYFFFVFTQICYL